MKRDDLQAIRGIAIILVFIFHLQPSVFPLGFIGVDMFFVLSGYLIALVLSKEPFSFTHMKEFYYRRFRRIVPLMYITILFVYFGCMFLLTGLDKDTFKTDLKWSIGFVSNFQPLFEIQGYWDQISSFRFLTHCWSLGVEIQFYLIAPWIMSIGNQLPVTTRRCILSGLIVASLCFQLLASPKVAHGLLPSRIWQFLLGSICFESKRDDNVEKDLELQDETGSRISKISSWSRIVQAFPDNSRISGYAECLLTFVCSAVALNWNNVLSMEVMRILATISVALLIKFPQNPAKSVLSNQVLVYIGDASYILYLIHWPIIVASKYIAMEALDVQTLLSLFIIIFALSGIIHKYIEKPIISLSFANGVALCAVCLGIIFASFSFYEECCLPPNLSKPESNVLDAIEWNTVESKKIFQSMPCSTDVTTPAWTGYDLEPELRCEARGKGNLTVLVIGNSIAYRAFPLIHEVLKGNYKELRLYARSARPPLTNKDPLFTQAVHKVVNKIRPDILWYAHGRINEANTPFDIPNKANDTMYNVFKEHINYYRNRVGVFILDMPYYTPPLYVSNELVKRQRFQQPLDKLKVSKSEAIQQQEEHRKRIKAVECSNCFYQNVESGMFEGDQLYFYNRANDHAYYQDGHHMTSEMLEKLKPLYNSTLELAYGFLRRRMIIVKKRNISPGMRRNTIS